MMNYESILFFIKMVLIIIVSLFMVYSSMLKLVAFPGMEESFVYWGYPGWLMYVIGVLELIISVAIYIKSTRWYGLILLLMVMSGAVYTHLINIEYDQLSSSICMITLTILIAILEWIGIKFGQTDVRG